MFNLKFIVCLFVLNGIFALGSILSEISQTSSIDLEAAILAQITERVRKELRLNAEKHLKKIGFETNTTRISKIKTN
jgi:hypothetical protein